MKVELVLETVTPLFLGGADPAKPELRPASVRGALRFWFRAGMGGIGLDGDLTSLRTLESRVFGQTESGSAVVVRLRSPRPPRPTTQPLLPHRHGGKAGPTDAIPVGTKFDLILSTRCTGQECMLETATWSALLWLTLGGLGRRSRRAAASVRLKSATAPRSFPSQLLDQLSALSDVATDGGSLSTKIASVLAGASRAFRQLAPASSPRSPAALPSYSVVGKDTRIVVWVPALTARNDPNVALGSLMTLMSDTNRRLGGGFEQGFGGIHPRRRASPLYVTLHPLTDGWAFVVTHLLARLRPDSEGNPGLVAQFLDDLKQKWEAWPLREEGKT